MTLLKKELVASVEGAWEDLKERADEDHRAFLEGRKGQGDWQVLEEACRIVASAAALLREKLSN
jgi:hypothetical protein